MHSTAFTAQHAALCQTVTDSSSMAKSSQQLTVWLAGYMIYTVVALAHAGLLLLEHQTVVHQSHQQ